MIFFPAIDLKDGQCVRLYQGDMEKATVFSDDPGGQARGFEDAGCRWLHVVDLNGAFEGKTINGEAIESILENVTIPVQLGGGIRDLETMRFWLDKGIRRVILGTVALKDPDLVKNGGRGISRSHCPRYRRQLWPSGGGRLGGGFRDHRP